jgi:hypothetical protein
MRRVVIAGGLWLGLCASAAAQTAGPDRPGPYVIDVRGTTISLPQDPSFYPPVSSTTAVPSQGWGIDAGAHVYPLQLGAARLGIGGMLLRARGTVSLESLPAVAALVTTVAPQVSVNFGSRAGWSYLSAGMGRATMTTRISAAGTAPARLVDSGARSSMNFGGGARWFARSHLAFTFDVRFHMVRAGGDLTPTPGTTLVAVSAGISLR